jgi:multicomponent Na+:H+ antiporter subunit C
VLILTAIVVGVATTSVGLALVVRIKEAYGTIEEDELVAEEAASA